MLLTTQLPVLQITLSLFLILLGGQSHGPSIQLQSGTWKRLKHILLDSEMGPDVSPRLKQSLGEDDTGLMTPDDANPELPMAAFATLWKDIPWR